MVILVAFCTSALNEKSKIVLPPPSFFTNPKDPFKSPVRLTSRESEAPCPCVAVASCDIEKVWVIGCPPAGGGEYRRFWLLVRQNRPSAVQFEPDGILMTYEGVAKGSALRIAAKSFASSPGSAVPVASHPVVPAVQRTLEAQRRARTSAMLVGMA
jgi:hypothetical protein